MFKSEKVSKYELPLKIKPQKGGGYLAECSVWSDCYAQGDTIDDAVLEITAVAQSLIELYKEEGLAVPLKLNEKRDIDNHLLLPIIVAS